MKKYLFYLMAIGAILVLALIVVFSRDIKPKHNLKVIQQIEEMNRTFKYHNGVLNAVARIAAATDYECPFFKDIAELAVMKLSDSASVIDLAEKARKAKTLKEKNSIQERISQMKAEADFKTYQEALDYNYRLSHPTLATQQRKKACLNYIRENAVNPGAYVIRKLKDHNIVILGEMHQQKDNLDFISTNVAKFYHEGGVRVFATEFIRSHNNRAINEIVTAKRFDYNRVVAIYRDFAWLWGFKGYLDIIQAIWRLNNSLPEKAEKLKIVGLDDEWKDWSGAKVEIDEINRDYYMANMFIKTYGSKNTGKAIIHCGFNHSFWDFTEYGVRMGYFLHQKYGEQLFQICLHQGFDIGSGQPGIDFNISGFIDEIYYENNNKPIGFDIINSPFENIRDEVSDYFRRDPETVFGKIAKGYIIFKPQKEMKCTPFVDNFIDNSNFKKAKEIIKNRGWFQFPDNISIDELNKKLVKFMSFSTH